MLVKQKENYHRALGSLQNYQEGQELSLVLYNQEYVAGRNVQP